MALLANHIAVVTGAGSGIGRAIAAGYAREGAQVVLLDVNADTAAEAAEGIRKAGGKAESFALDVTRRDDCFALAKQVADKVGQVSILVNNAGITRRNAFTAETETVAKDWNDIISLNLNGVFNTTQALWVRKGQRGFEQGSVTWPPIAPPASTSVAVNVTIPAPGWM